MIHRDPVKECRQPQAVPCRCGVSVKLPRCRPDLAEDISAQKTVHSVLKIGGHHNRSDRVVGHSLFFRETIGGVSAVPRIPFPIEYPTMDPRSPVAALWSILLVDIKTVMQIMATRTINAFGGLVMFILGTLVVLAGQDKAPTVHKGCRIHRNRQVMGHHTRTLQSRTVCNLLFRKLPLPSCHLVTNCDTYLIASS